MRVAEFNREQVLQSAMNEFIAKGYNKTSMQDLKRVTGLHPGSIYCAFENKRGLLLAALEQYAKDREDEFASIFAKEATILAGFRRYLEHIISECECEQIKDCLLQKSLSEFSQQDDEVEQAVVAIIQIWKKGIQTQLELAQQRQEIAADKNCLQLGEFFIMGIYGLRSYAHTKPGPGVLQRLADQLYQTLAN